MTQMELGVLEELLDTKLRRGYRPERILGVGSFGVTFQAEQSFFGVDVRRVALKVAKVPGLDTKVLREALNDAFILAQAMDEMTDTEARSHLVSLYDAGEVEVEPSRAEDRELQVRLGKRAYVAMEYVPCTDLAAQLTSHGGVPPNLVLKWVRQMAYTLGVLHDLTPPVIHRDLKPANVLLGADMSIRIIDFGLAARLQASGIVPGVAGTQMFMAPETTQGESVRGSDVYSLGVLMYEALAGVHPFADIVPPIGQPDALYSDWMYAQKQRMRTAPPFHNNRVTAKLHGVVMDCLQFDPRLRIPNGAALVQALDEAATPTPTTPDVRALEGGQALLRQRDWEGAHRCFARGLGAPPQRPETRFALLRGMGEALGGMEDHGEAARKLADAWQCVERDAALLRTREERIELLELVVREFELASNHFQSGRYLDKLDDLKRALR